MFSKAAEACTITMGVCKGWFRRRVSSAVHIGAEPVASLVVSLKIHTHCSSLLNWDLLDYLVVSMGTWYLLGKQTPNCAVLLSSVGVVVELGIL